MRKPLQPIEAMHQVEHWQGYTATAKRQHIWPLKPFTQQNGPCLEHLQWFERLEAGLQDHAIRQMHPHWHLRQTHLLIKSAIMSGRSDACASTNAYISIKGWQCHRRREPASDP